MPGQCAWPEHEDVGRIPWPAVVKVATQRANKLVEAFRKPASSVHVGRQRLYAAA
jgi:hypothetical protein